MSNYQTPNNTTTQGEGELDISFRPGLRRLRRMHPRSLFRQESPRGVNAIDNLAYAEHFQGNENTNRGGRRRRKKRKRKSTKKKRKRRRKSTKKKRRRRRR